MLWDALHSSAPPSRFACSGRLDGKVPFFLPDISVAGVGRLGLPLSKEQAVRLKAGAEQAPHGRGLRTVVDTAVRDAFQVSGSAAQQQQQQQQQQKWRSSSGEQQQQQQY
jgi:hypothetical protein